jgi:hypothetical protein
VPDSSASRVALLVAAAAIGLAACAGTSSPHVASLGTRSTTSSPTSGPGAGHRSATTPAKGNPTALLNDWAACMRSHGDSGQADPTIDFNKVIHITWNPATPGGIYGTNKGGQGNSGPGQYCRADLIDAQTALRGDQPQERPDQATLEKFSECMRASGLPDFPDPTTNGLSISMNAGGDLNPANPSFQTASRLCARKTGAHVPGGGGTPPPGTIELNGAGA